ncbi:hypothetical protein RND81_10G130400 [Saponaria officinalis]|uniref:Retrotransposon Copia-like N-terminal domain-containing protein n=1 Tax=Saponaria officinalis TaxID=3572 RepID=A0AAW1I425_SAPOF
MDPQTSATSSFLQNHEDPFLLQSSDHPGMKLVAHDFEGVGFGNWKRSMRIALSAKNKLCFVDGTKTKPSSTDPTAKNWQRCNDMVFSWLLNVLSNEIANSVLYCESAQAIWEELEDRYGQTNGAQLFSVQKKLSDFSQGSDNITAYFTKIKSIWDEIDSMGMNPSCSRACSCGSKHKQVKYQEDQKIVQFLMGLNDSYTVIRGAILMQNPLPKLAVVYNTLVQEERQREIHATFQFQTDSASLYAKNVRPPINQRYNPYNNNKNTQPGHKVDQCYKLQNRNRKFAAHVQPTGSDGILGKFDANQSVSEDYSTSQLDPNQSVDPYIPSSVNFAGNSSCSVPLNSSLMRNCWILDSGATDHMCSNKSLFIDLMHLVKPYSISLPNGQTVVISFVGSVHISSDLILRNVLYVPCFKFNLLSIAKLTKQHRLSVTFTSDICYLQGSFLKTPLTLGSNQRDLYFLTPSAPIISMPSADVPATNTKPHKDKLDVRAFPYVFIGYPFGKKAYKLFNLSTQTVFFSRDVVFHESVFPFSDSDKPSFKPLPVPDSEQTSTHTHTTDVHENANARDSTNLSSSTMSTTAPGVNSHTDVSSHTAPARHSARVSRPPSYLQNYVCQNCLQFCFH